VKYYNLVDTASYIMATTDLALDADIIMVKRNKPCRPLWRMHA
jgi:hypothetical protein